MTVTLGAVFGPARSFPGTSQALSFGTVTAGQLVTFEVVYWNPVAVDVLTVADVTASGTATISPLSVDRQDGIQADTAVWLRTAVYSCVVRTGGTLTLTLAGLQAGAAPTVFGATFNATQGWSEVPTFRIDGAGAGAATASNGLTSWASGSATSTATSDRNSVHIGVLAWNAGVNSNLTITGGLFSSIGVENDGTSFEPGAASYLIDTTATSADASWSGTMTGAASEGASATQVIYREGQGWNKTGTGPRMITTLGSPLGMGPVEAYLRGTFSGASGVSGTFSRTANSDGLVASGTTTVVGVFSRTALSDTLTSPGTTTVVGTFTRTTNNDVLVAAGTTTVRGTFSRTALDDVLSAAGIVNPVTGTFSRTAVSDILAATGTTTVVSVFSRTAGSDVLVATGTTTVVGVCNRTALSDTLAALGTTTIVSTFTRTALSDTLVASGSIGSAVSGSFSTTALNDSLNASGNITILGTFSRTALNDTLSAVATTTIVGQFVRTNNDDILAANGLVGAPVAGASIWRTLTNVGK